MIIIDCPQQSLQWFQEKAGKPGSSSFDKIVTTKGEPSKSRTDYLYQLVGETLIGRQEEGFSNWAMQQGVEREAESREAFELTQNVKIRQVGVIYPDESKQYLCSPDGLFADDTEGVELKNPLLKTHIKYLLNGGLPTEYFCQVQGSMLCSGFSRWWFMSYYPGVEPLIIEVQRDEPFIEKLKAELERFCMDTAILLRKIKGG